MVILDELIVTTFNLKGNHNMEDSGYRTHRIVTTFNLKGNHNSQGRGWRM